MAGGKPDTTRTSAEKFSSGPEKKCDQHRTGQCVGVKEDPESSPTEFSGERGTGVLSPAAEQDACLLHKDDSDRSMYSCPSPASDRGGKDLKNLAVPLSPQVWFDTEVLEAHESDNLDVVATTEQHSKTAFRSDVQVEPSEEAPVNSESITGVDIQKVERKFAVRNVTELVVDAGQQRDRGRETRSNDVDGSVRGLKSAGRIERLLRNKRNFEELGNQKGECVRSLATSSCAVFPR